MAVTSGDELYQLNISDGTDTVQHPIKDAKAREDIGGLKSAFETETAMTVLPSNITAGKYIYYTGVITDAAASVANQYEVTDFVDVSDYDKVAITASSYTSRLYYAFYDSNKNYISNSGKAYISGTVLRDEVVDVPSGAKYCVAMWYYSTATNNPIIKGVENSYYVKRAVLFDKTQSLTSGEKQTARNNIGALAADAIGGGNITISSESTDVITGKAYDESYGVLFLNTAAGYNTISLIDITSLSIGSNVSIKASLVNGHGAFIVDANNNVLDYVSSANAASRGYAVSSEPQLVTLTVPENAKYITSTIRDYYYTGVSDFNVYGIEMSDIEKNERDIDLLFDAVNNPDNVLRGKKWAPCGDSFTYYTNKRFESGPFIGLNTTYPRLIAERNGMTLCTDFFASGKTLAYPSDGTFTNSLTCPTVAGYYQNIPADVDYITIMLGINDSQHTGSGSTGDGEDATGVITLGDITDTTTSTYYGAYNNVLGWIRENRPYAHVGIIVTNGTERQDYTEAQIAIAKKWGYPLLNLNGDEHTPAMLRCYNTDLSADLKTLIKQKQAVNYSGEGGSVDLHPNWQAHEYESTFIEDFLRRI